MSKRKILAVVFVLQFALALSGCNNISTIAAKVRGGYSEDAIAGGWKSEANGPLVLNEGVFYFSPNEKTGGQHVKLMFLKLSDEDDSDSYIYTIDRLSDKSFSIKYYTYNILQNKPVYTSKASNLSISIVSKKTLQICGDLTGDKIVTLSKIDDGMAKGIIGE